MKEKKNPPNYYFDPDRFFDLLTTKGQSAEDEALKMIYTVAWKVVHLKCSRSTHQQDIVQNAVLRIWKSAQAGKLDFNKSPLSYMTMIVQNEIKRLNGKNLKYWKSEVSINDFI